MRKLTARVFFFFITFLFSLGNSRCVAIGRNLPAEYVTKSIRLHSLVFQKSEKVDILENGP